MTIRYVTFAVCCVAAVCAFGQQSAGNPAALNPKEKSDAPQKDPKPLTDAQVEDLRPDSQTKANGKDRNVRADANDTWVEWFADLVDEEVGDSGKTATDKPSQKQNTIHSFITQYDTNRDGAVAPGELPKGMKHGFRQIDRNHDGKLAVDEIRQHVRRQRMAQAPAMVTQVWLLEAHDTPAKLEDLQEAYATLKEVDKDSDGKITREELTARRQQIASKWVDQCFENHDENHDGQLTREESRGTAVASRFERYDANDDARIGKKELMQSFAADVDAAQQKRGN